jgi:plastocyanin
MPHHSPTRSVRTRATLAALPAIALVLAACSSGSSTSEPPASQAAGSQPPASQSAGSQAPASQSPAGGTTVTLSGLAFSVAEITVPVGPLTFVNEDAVPHLLAEGENGVEVSSPRVQKVSINPNSQGDLVFTVAGDYNITCTIHKTMNMVVHVQ